MSTKGTAVIVAGHVCVDPAQRDAYLAGCAEVVRQARSATGCLDFAVSADLLDAGRVNIYERWASQSAVEAFRGSGPGEDQSEAMVSASVAEYDVTDERSQT
ncbi:MAG TPA: antibiotic biosynthesis monooxygenase family protein [Mycobacterium sp.]|nr:antibiotic biosynthesis monooxygenase family protein [Mycobacterium sp.]